jgi:mediator of RNA polymerase II transcription subunit 17
VGHILQYFCVLTRKRGAFFISVAHGELSLARDLLSSLLPDPVLSQLVQSAQPAAVAPTRSLTSTVVTGPAARDPAVQAFDAQLVVGGKDQGMRAAASILKTAASDVESARIADECYWVDALKLRRANWGLMPAPLPFGAGNTRASERPSTDFLISCGLEECKRLLADTSTLMVTS